MDLSKLVVEKRDEIRAIAKKHGAKNIRLFGSVSRKDHTPDSDIDFLVDTGERTSSWFPAGLVIDLEEILGHRVEIVTEKGLSPLLRRRILDEAMPI